MQMCTSVPRAIYEKEPRTSRGTCSSDRASIACHIGILRRRSFRNQSTHPREAIQDRFGASISKAAPVRKLSQIAPASLREALRAGVQTLYREPGSSMNPKAAIGKLVAFPPCVCRRAVTKIRGTGLALQRANY